MTIRMNLGEDSYDILVERGSLADVDKYDERNWGGNAYEYALTLCLDAVLKL